MNVQDKYQIVQTYYGNGDPSSSKISWAPDIPALSQNKGDPLKVAGALNAPKT